MPSENTLIKIRRAFAIPDSVFIMAGEKFNITGGRIGSPPDGSQYNIPQGPTPDAPLYSGLLNTPVYTNIRFLDVEYTDNAGRVVDTQGLTYDAVLIMVSQAKKIITTEIQGMDGTVKEYIGMDDYVVQVQGIITGANGVHPVDDIAALKKMLDAPVPIPVVCDYLQRLRIYNLVVFSYDLGQEEGGYSYQKFSITFKSDIPVQLIISGQV